MGWFWKFGLIEVDQVISKNMKPLNTLVKIAIKDEIETSILNEIVDEAHSRIFYEAWGECLSEFRDEVKNEVGDRVLSSLKMDVK